MEYSAFLPTIPTELFTSGYGNAYRHFTLASNVSKHSVNLCTNRFTTVFASIVTYLKAFILNVKDSVLSAEVRTNEYLL